MELRSLIKEENDTAANSRTGKEQREKGKGKMTCKKKMKEQ